MVARAEGGARHGTRRRTALLGTAASGLLALMFTAVTQNVMAVNFAASNTSYKVYTDRVVGQYAAGYMSSQALQSGSVPAFQIGFKSADLYGLCAVANQSLGPGGTIPVTLVIKAGEKVDGTVTDPAGKQIRSSFLYLSGEGLSGNGENISKLTLGQSADTLTMQDTPFAGAPGGFGLQAEVMQVGNLDATSRGINLQGNINLPDMEIKVLPGTVAKGSAC